MSALAKIQIIVDVLEQQTDKGVAGARASLNHQLDQRVTRVSGVADGEQDLVYSDVLAIGTSPTDLDLNALLSELDGSAVAFVEVTAIYIRHKGTTGTLLIGGGTVGVPIFSSTTDILELGAGGVFVWESPLAGVPVTEATADVLRLQASAGTISADVIILGRSA